MAQAANLDDRLVAVSHMAPGWRSHLVTDLSREVAEVEATAAHLSRVATSWRAQMATPTPYAPLPPLDLGSRLDAVEAALFEAIHAAAATVPGPMGPVGAPVASLTGTARGGRL